MSEEHEQQVKAQVRFVNGNQFAAIIDALSSMFPEVPIIFTENTMEIHASSKGSAVVCHMILDADRIRAENGGDKSAFWTVPIAEGGGFLTGMNLTTISKSIGGAPGSGCIIDLKITGFPGRIYVTVSNKEGAERDEYDFKICNIKGDSTVDYDFDERHDFKLALKSERLKENCAKFKKLDCKDIAICLYENELQFISENGAGSAAGLTSRVTTVVDGRLVDKGKLKFSGVFPLDHLQNISKFSGVCKEMQILFYSEKSGRYEGAGSAIESFRQPQHIDIVCNLAYGEIRFSINSMRESKVAKMGGGGGGGGGVPPVGAPGMAALGHMTPGAYISASLAGPAAPLTFPPIPPFNVN